MKKKILINALHSEEKRVAIVDGDLLVDFYVESAEKEHLKGNICKGVVVRIEPGLQAAFVDFGPKKHGFLQMREIKPEFYQKKVEGKRPRIQDVISKGHELIVQVEKDERDNKGASLTTYISIPGRYIVMMPGQERVGISRKIEAKEDRERLKETFQNLKLPKDMGFILRTACNDQSGAELENDLKYLTKLWTRIQTDSSKVSAPALIYKEQDIAVRTVRDYLTSEVNEVLIDDPEAYKNTKEFLKKIVPWRRINIKLYKDKQPIFARHNIEEQISKLHERYVYLPSRGYLVIDKTEALTAVDVNSGRSRKEENVEATAFKTNMEAADEVARQFRLRDIGGLIVIDFIDMASSKNRREVERKLQDNLDADKAHTEITSISKFGMVELTRERLRTAYFEATNKKCEICGGTGTVRTDEMVAVTAIRDIHSKVSKGGLKSVSCRMPVGSLNYIVNTKRNEIVMIEKDFGIKLTLNADLSLSGQYILDVAKDEAATEQDEPKKQVEAKQQPEPRQHQKPKQHGPRPHPEPKKQVEEMPQPSAGVEEQADVVKPTEADKPLEPKPHTEVKKRQRRRRSNAKKKQSEAKNQEDTIQRIEAEQQTDSEKHEVKEQEEVTQPAS